MKKFLFVLFLLSGIACDCGDSACFEFCHSKCYFYLEDDNIQEYEECFDECEKNYVETHNQGTDEDCNFISDFSPSIDGGTVEECWTKCVWCQYPEDKSPLCLSCKKEVCNN